MAKERIWTPVVRQLLFERLTKEFGPARKWETSSRPGGGRDQAFDRFCARFAKVVSANSAKAVKQQIRFGMPVAGEATWGQGQTQTAILCLAAAFEAGFIQDSDLPRLTATGRRNSN